MFNEEELPQRLTEFWWVCTEAVQNWSQLIQTEKIMKNSVHSPSFNSSKNHFLFFFSQSTKLGVEAVVALLDATPDTPACVIGLSGNHAVRLPLMECVEMVSHLVFLLYISSTETLTTGSGSVVEPSTTDCRLSWCSRPWTRRGLRRQSNCVEGESGHLSLNNKKKIWSHVFVCLCSPIKVKPIRTELFLAGVLRTTGTSTNSSPTRNRPSQKWVSDYYNSQFWLAHAVVLYTTTGVDNNYCLIFPQSNFSVAILNVGAPAAGMNAAMRSAVRLGLANGHKVYGVHDGFQGLANGAVGASVI